MMTTQAESDEDVSKVIGTMDVIWQRLLNVCPDGTVSVENLYVSSLMYALPESWTLVTAPLELQQQVTPAKIKKVLHNHVIKLKNHNTSTVTSSFAALSAKALAKKSEPKQNPSWPECDHCHCQGHLFNTCHLKQMEEKHKEIDALKESINSKSGKSAKLAQISDSN